MISELTAYIGIRAPLARSLQSAKDGIHLKPKAYDLWYKAIEGYVYE